jgi:hypothetical protein
MLAYNADYIWAPGYDNSLARVQSVHPEGVPDSDIVKYLCLKDQAELEELHALACAKLRAYLTS